MAKKIGAGKPAPTLVKDYYKGVKVLRLNFSGKGDHHRHLVIQHLYETLLYLEVLCVSSIINHSYLTFSQSGDDGGVILKDLKLSGDTGHFYGFDLCLVKFAFWRKDDTIHGLCFMPHSQQEASCL